MPFVLKDDTWVLFLGLYISNKIITSHKGKITAKNNESKGATFTITLPL